jgi:hypothetical protein
MVSSNVNRSARTTTNGFATTGTVTTRGQASIRPFSQVKDCIGKEEGFPFVDIRFCF